MNVRAEAVTIPAPYTQVSCCGSYIVALSRYGRVAVAQVTPKGDRVLVKVAKVEEKTVGGIVLPVSAQKRPTSGPESCAP